MLENRNLWIPAVLSLLPALALGCKASPSDTKADPKSTAAPDKTPDSKAEGGEVEAPKQPETPDTDNPDSDCTADPAWVTSPSEFPADTFSANSNCSFHQWAYQNFLWLTSPGEDDQLVFETFANPMNLFVAEPGDYPGADAGENVDMLARFGKSQTTADIEDIFQAGPGNKALIDQGGNIVYYANHLDDNYWNFIVDNGFNTLENLQKADPTKNFSVGSLELKSSWRVAELDGKVIIPDAAKRFHVVETEIPTVTPDPDTGVLTEDPNNMQKAKMALVGIHVTGVVEGHPEFIWATFEHVDNAPACASAPAANTHGGWNFNDGKATSATSNQFNVGNPMAVVNVCEVNQNGAGSQDNQNAIVTLNNNVQRIIADQGGSVWSNYRLIGAVWTSAPSGGDAFVPLNNGDFSPANKDAGATQLGSLLLANTSMETFTQNDNCFACHNGGAHEIVVGDQSTSVNAKNINLSHFVVNFQAQQQVTTN